MNATSRLADAKHFDTREDAEAALADVGDTAWGCTVLSKCVGSVYVRGAEHPIVIVEVEVQDGSESRLFLFGD